MRFIVVETDPRRLVGEPCEPLPVGMVRWPGERLTIVVKGTYRYRPAVERQRLRLSPRQEPLTLASPTTVADLVAFKPQTDVVLVGHAFAPRPSERIGARLQIDTIDRLFCVVGPASERLSLCDGNVRALDGVSPAAPVGPVAPAGDVPGAEDGGPVALPRWERPEEDEGERDWHDLGDAGDLYRTGGVSCAAPEQRCTHIQSAGTLTLTGLSEGGGTRVLELPEHTPIVVVETSRGHYWVTMYCDTVAIDTDRQTVTLVWRGQVPCRGKADDVVQRIVVSLERDDEELRPIGVVYAGLQRGHCFRAVEEPDLVEGGGKPPDEDPELLLARYQSWDATPEPALDLERYAAVSFALAAGAERGEVLARHALDDESWLLEEHAWLSRLAAAAGTDDPLLGRYESLMGALRRGASSKGNEP